MFEQKCLYLSSHDRWIKSLSISLAILDSFQYIHVLGSPGHSPAVSPRCGAAGRTACLHLLQRSSQPSPGGCWQLLACGRGVVHLHRQGMLCKALHHRLRFYFVALPQYFVSFLCFLGSARQRTRRRRHRQWVTPV